MHLYFPQHVLHPVLPRGVEGEVAESINQKLYSSSLRGGPPRRWVRAGEEHFLTPIIRSGGHLLPQEEGFSSQSAAVDSATPGKPCVQNDMSES